jgi:hypothetical protein
METDVSRHDQTGRITMTKAVRRDVMIGIVIGYAAVVTVLLIVLLIAILRTI